MFTPHNVASSFMFTCGAIAGVCIGRSSTLSLAWKIICILIAGVLAAAIG